jgi:hypothetical protein
MIDAPAVPLMDNCSARIAPAIIRLLSDYRVKEIVFPPHTSEVFQMLDLVFFGVLNHATKYLVKNKALLVILDCDIRMFKACESAGRIPPFGIPLCMWDSFMKRNQMEDILLG